MAGACLHHASDATDIVVLRIVIREGLTRELGEALVGDLKSATDDLLSDPPLRSAQRSGFAH